MKQVNRASWARLSLELEQVPKGRARSFRSRHLVVQTGRRAAAELAHMSLGHLSRQDLQLMAQTLERALSVQKRGETAFETLWRVVLALVCIRDDVGGSFKRVEQLIAKSEGVFCREDRRFLLLMTNILWTIEEQGNFSWQAKYCGRPLFRDHDASFFATYVADAAKRHRLVKLLDGNQRQQRGIDRNECSRQACAVTAALIRTAKRRSSILSTRNLMTLQGRLVHLTQRLTADPTYQPSLQDRLSIQELALVAKADRFCAPLQPLVDNQVLAGDVRDTYECVKHASVGLKTAEMFINSRPGYQVGDLACSHGAKERLSRGKSADPWSLKVQRWITGTHYTHAGLVLPANQAAHVLGGFVRKSITLDELAYSEFFRLNMEKLVTDAGRKALSETLGATWSKQVHARYQSIMVDFLSNSARFEGIENAMGRRRLSVIKPHWQLKSSVLKDSDFRHRELFCTEFVAKTLHVVLNRLEIELQSNFNDVHKGMPTAYLNKVFSAHENFSAVHPGYLLKKLSPYGQFAKKRGRLSAYLKESLAENNP